MSRALQMGAVQIGVLLAVVACGDDGGEEARDLGSDASAQVDLGDGGADLGAPDLGADLGSDAGPEDLGVPDTGVDMSVPPVLVSHARELRAMWVATVFRLDFPSAAGLDAAAAEAELRALVAETRAQGLNALFFQVRAEGDAFYASALEPWSRFLTGVQGSHPGWDPLGLLVDLAHAEGIEVHAWVNPYRAATDPGSPRDPLHVAQRFPAATLAYGSGLVMNPADPAVRAHVLDVIEDVVTRYDVDGVVFDDYFYPYPTSEPFPDDADYLAYVDGGGALSKSDWRRSNVDALVSAVGPRIHGVKPWVRWGIAPFGIYRPGQPAGVVGLDAYEVLAADAKRWVEEGWVDYISPQLYWSTASTGQPFGPLAEWWGALPTGGRHLMPSLGLYRFGASAEWTTDEFRAEVALLRALGPVHGGHAWFRDGSRTADLDAMFRDLYAIPARPPQVPGYDAGVDPPEVTPVLGGLSLAHPEPDEVRGYGLYVEDAGVWRLEQWLPASRTSVATLPGTYVVSAIDRGGVESLGVQVEVR